VIKRTIEAIKIEEGFIPRCYHCSEGYVTLGYGELKSDEKWDDLSKYPEMITEPEAAVFVWERCFELYMQFIDNASSRDAFLGLNEARRGAIISMGYQMGFERCLAFKNMWQALLVGDFDRASKEMLNSKWARQTERRAKRHAEQMRTGKWHSYYN